MFDGGRVSPSRVDAMCAVARRVAATQAELLAAMAAVAEESVGVGFDADEVAFALRLQRVAAQRDVVLARDLIGRLPAVFAALSAGTICLARARVFSDVLLPVQDDDLVRSIADGVLARAEEWTAAQIRYRLLKALLTADPDAAAQRMAHSIEQRRVSLTANDDTTACLSAIYLPPAKAAVAFERVDAIARGLKNDGAEPTLDQLRADVFLDLLAGISPAVGPVLRSGAVELLVPLATLTGQSNAPGVLAGYGPVIADIARQVAAQSAKSGTSLADGDGGLGATAAAAGGVVAPAAPMQWRYRVVDEDGTLLFRGTTRARPQPAAPQNSGDSEPLGSGQAGLREHSGRSAVGERGPGKRQPGDGVPQAHAGAGQNASTHRQQASAQSGSQDSARQRPYVPEQSGPVQRGPEQGGPEQRGAPQRGPTASQSAHPATTHGADVGRERRQPCPPAQDDPTARFPNSRLRGWIAARDNSCRAPGCIAPARSCDVDHTVDHATGGRTTHDNLGLACRHHHRLKHEGGFRLEQPQPGHFRWISPTGHIYDVPPDPP